MLEAQDLAGLRLAVPRQLGLAERAEGAAAGAAAAAGGRCSGGRIGRGSGRWAACSAESNNVNQPARKYAYDGTKRASLRCMQGG